MALPARIATATMSREIFQIFGNFCNRYRRCKTDRGIPQGDFSTLSHIRFLIFCVIAALTTRREACHWILSRLRLPTARLSATHDDLRIAGAPSNHVRCCDSSSLATARDDERGLVSLFRKRYWEKMSLPDIVISTGVSMPYNSTTKNCYSFEEWRNLSCFRKCRAFHSNTEAKARHSHLPGRSLDSLPHTILTIFHTPTLTPARDDESGKESPG